MITERRNARVAQSAATNGYVIDPHAVAEAILRRRAEQVAQLSGMLVSAELDGLSGGVPEHEAAAGRDLS